MQVVPLQAIPSQTVSVLLNSQQCRINVYQKSTGLFCDLLVNGSQIIGGVICENLNRIVRDAYLGFVGDICFFDTQGQQGSTLNPPTDPVSTGLGTRYVLLYLAPSDFDTFVQPGITP